MTAVNQSPITQHDLLQLNNNHLKTPSVEIDRESYGSSSEDIDNYSPKSVVSRTTRRWPPVVKRRVRSQIERIRAEDSHLGEDIGECLILKICSAVSYDDDDVSRPASPLSGIKGVDLHSRRQLK
ncbi:hypothetical protein QVD17_04700 [Tagetes erecta]|uniref:Uncharacterized protein n=1 Tax=Tagetes erecta TaxID=13708 RepID=A0AAD8P9Z1_TARER|nr:hypothetical protein QVD17_04700 [Tagetes erecta]